MIDLKYNIGQKYIDRNKHENTIVDICTITNNNGEIIKKYYVTEKLFCGQCVVCNETPEATITLALLKQKGN